MPPHFSFSQIPDASLRNPSHNFLWQDFLMLPVLACFISKQNEWASFRMGGLLIPPDCGMYFLGENSEFQRRKTAGSTQPYEACAGGCSQSQSGCRDSKARVIGG
jgi:hypothetical protein